jgi:hypothetical protein
MPIRSFALKTTGLLAAAAMLFPAARAATGMATNVALTITTPGAISYGETVSGYAVVSTADGSALSGTVSFFDGAANLCTIPVTQATSCPPSVGAGFAVGTHLVTAVYSGDEAHLGSVSNAVPVVVVPDATAVSLASSSNPATAGESVTFTATVKAAGQAPIPIGPVIFMDDSAEMGAAMLNSSGSATFSTAALGPGSHSVSAKYTGSVTATPSSSASLAETINGSTSTGDAPFTMTVTGKPTVAAGSAVDLTVTVAPQSGSIGPVGLSCSGLPSESVCTFGTATLPTGGGTTSLRISTTAPHGCAADASSSSSAGVRLEHFSCGSPIRDGRSAVFSLKKTPTVPYSTYGKNAAAGSALAGLLLLFLPRRRRWHLKGLLMIAATCGMAVLSGCGNCTDLGTRPGDYTIRVIGTSTEGAASTIEVVLHVTAP